MDLTNEHWEVLEPLIPDPLCRAYGRGRPRRDPRDVLNGILPICVPVLPGAAAGGALRAEGEELPRPRATGVHRHPTEAFVRWLLENLQPTLTPPGAVVGGIY